MRSKNVLRILLASLIVLSGVAVVSAYATQSGGDADFRGMTEADVMAERPTVAPPRDNATVIATDSNSWRGRESDGPRARAELVGINPNGTVEYYNDSHTRYWDVDPVAGTKSTVEYMYADHLNASACPADWGGYAERHGVSEEIWNEYLREHGRIDACTRDGFERVNLTTGEVTPVWSRITPGKEATRYHDADRINETHIAVADIYLDRVFIVNTETDETTWSWNARSEFDPKSTGGPYPKDWSHINDVEVLQDGRIMISVRNHDQVLFIEPGSGLQKNWTLGEDDSLEIIYEQHNPDYIPESQGGPAVLVADSENNRVIEYQRRNGGWERSWVWQDARMQWPRDADRLPNGHTLITDSNGNRVFEIDRKGNVVWNTKIAFPYESERLGTGGESTGGPSAASANLQSHDPGLVGSFWIGVKDLLPGKYLNGFMYITPVWMGVPVASALLLGVLALLAWALLEVAWVLGSLDLRSRLSGSRSK